MTPEEIADIILELLDEPRHPVHVSNIARMIRAYGDERARQERERVVALIRDWQPSGRASDMDALVAALDTAAPGAS